MSKALKRVTEKSDVSMSWIILSIRGSVHWSVDKNYKNIIGCLSAPGYFKATFDVVTLDFLYNFFHKFHIICQEN